MIIRIASATTTDAAATTIPPTASHSSTLDLVVFFVPAFVAFPSGFVVWRAVRKAVLNWYRSRDFLITGRTAMEMMTKEVGLRLQVEWIPLLVGLFTVSVVWMGVFMMLAAFFAPKTT